MTELKTLKDFEKEKFYSQEGQCSYNHALIMLKAEAVKWVKEITKDQNNKGNFQSNHMNPRKQGQISWIKHFFNLTEEDLKDFT